MTTQEERRLDEAREQQVPWKKWGPYLSERQWGTVREDYSPSGTAWDSFSHSQALSRAYRWGEDGLAGISDDRQTLCFALALWNGADPILKERMFGLTNSEGNHGEDVKEYYFYLDSTPTHSYMKYLYKYPQAAYPYTDLVETNRRRSRAEPEYELLDTGIFDDNRYFDVFVEYAKNTPEDLLIQITVHNRGKKPAKLQLAPTLWFRNTWSWGENSQKPVIEEDRISGSGLVIAARHPLLGERFLYCDSAEELLFTENETNNQRLWGGSNASPYVKDGINDYIVHGATAAVNPEHRGTKAAARYQLEIGPGKSGVVRLRLSETPPASLPMHNGGSVTGSDFDRLLRDRREEADEFYASITPKAITDDQRNVMRQALAGMLWSKQYYNYPVEDWLIGDPILEPPPEHQHGRNAGWVHLASGDVISMPDKWEYPWFAAWDLAIQTLPLAMVDLDFAKNQLLLMLEARYMHPNGQVPAYEWAFGDVNPPLLGFAAWRLYILEQQQRQRKDQEFLKRVFQKLALNFTWWVNRKDTTGRNVFEGGFLGLDNIGVFDRSAPLPTGGYLEQSDGTSWMALYCLNMVEIALELAKDDPAYLDLVRKFYQHFLYIATAMDAVGENADELWDEEDGFYYDLLHLPDGRTIRLKIRSLVGLLPVVATAVMTPEELELTPYYSEGIANFFRHHPKLMQNISSLDKPGVEGRRLASVLNEDKLRRILARMLDESEFLSPYGIRAISRYHKDHPYGFWVGGQEFRVDYEPAESSTGLFGGNSNWRGPIWMPINVLLVEALAKLSLYYGDTFKVECPTGSGVLMTLDQVAVELSRRLQSIFLRAEGADVPVDQRGRRPVYGGTEKFQHDPYWRDLILFYEYFHGDNGAGIGASHQTGWTGAIARLIQATGIGEGTRFSFNLKPSAKQRKQEPRPAGATR
jgi:hypothetical protein